MTRITRRSLFAGLASAGTLAVLASLTGRPFPLTLASA